MLAAPVVLLWSLFSLKCSLGLRAMLRCLFVAALSTCVNAGADFPDYDLDTLKARAKVWRLVFPDTLSLFYALFL